MTERFDLVVIGSGSGLEVASAAIEQGQKVAIIDNGPFGGTCLNRGCIPSKMLIHCADVMETVQRSEQFGIKAHVTNIDWTFIIDRAYKEIDAEAAAIEQANRRHPLVTVLKGTAQFVAKRTLDVDGRRISGESVVIAAGTRPSIPDISGLGSAPYITSDQALRLPRQPQQIAILGGGFIAAELAHFFGALGTQVTLIHRRANLLRNEDEDVARVFTDVYRRRFDLITEAKVMEVRGNDGGVKILLDVAGHQREVNAEALLLAVGRIPNTDLLDVGKAGVAVDERGFIKTNEYLQTSAPNVWALGDIVGKFLLKHSANLEAAYVANNLFSPNDKVAVNYHAMPHAIFASPQVAGVGLTEQEARDQHIPYVAGRYDYKNTAYGQSIGDQDGFVKVIAHAETKEILGCHILGTHASILIQEAANAMRSRESVGVITRAIYVHPALPEVVQRAFSSLEFR